MERPDVIPPVKLVNELFVSVHHDHHCVLAADDDDDDAPLDAGGIIP